MFEGRKFSQRGLGEEVRAQCRYLSRLERKLWRSTLQVTAAQVLHVYDVGDAEHWER